MCEFQTRVHSCGHYAKTLLEPCKEAKKSKVPCETGSEDSKTTGGLCYLPGCDRLPRHRREGPNDREDGGFDSDDIDWSEFR
ncbi:hypothetical protein AJ80_09895 [Polytolypa hystricis UAMH7299]|uniref:Uncharacterized protein n=1 Tax=Polytolypa hystricis (strain UAMH7299) TaxID=1447883 RepID=A0A2B7WH52_POLH7|nr:hypothetical protein AJ80_09895 [Polytolypa hystricis UAMH7299]